MAAAQDPQQIMVDRDAAPLSSDAASPPDEVRLLRNMRTIELEWPNHHVLRLGFAQLRHNCRCADCTARRRAGLEIEAPNEIEIVDINALGSGALQFIFSDGHDRGIFPWQYLRLLAHAPDAGQRET